MVKAYFLFSSTGCTCCRSDNMVFGPYREVSSATQSEETQRTSKRFASQFAAEGRHEIAEAEAEQLPDGRLIIGDRVFPGFAEDGHDDEVCHPDVFHTDVEFINSSK